MTLLYHAYKRLTSDLETHVDSMKGMTKEFPWKWKQKVGIAILKSDKINLRKKTVIIDKQALHNDKGVNPTRDTSISSSYCSSFCCASQILCFL